MTLFQFKERERDRDFHDGIAFLLFFLSLLSLRVLVDFISSKSFLLSFFFCKACDDGQEKKKTVDASLFSKNAVTIAAAARARRKEEERKRATSTATASLAVPQPTRAAAVARADVAPLPPSVPAAAAASKAQPAITPHAPKPRKKKRELQEIPEDHRGKPVTYELDCEELFAKSFDRREVLREVLERKGKTYRSSSASGKNNTKKKEGERKMMAMMARRYRLPYEKSKKRFETVASRRKTEVTDAICKLNGRRSTRE